LSEKSASLSAVLSYGELKAEFSGTPEAVLQSINEFVVKQIPSLDLAKKIHVNYSTQDLIRMFSSHVKITPEGPRVWSEGHKLSDKDMVALQLVASRIGFESGRTPNRALSVSEIQSFTNLNPKSASSRLSELAKAGYVERETSDQGARYRITTQGIHWLDGVLSKKTSRIG